MKFTTEQLIADLEEIVQEKGADHKEDCIYSKPTDPFRQVSGENPLVPVCIAGQWVAKRAPELLGNLAGAWDAMAGLCGGRIHEDFHNDAVAELLDEQGHKVLTVAQRIQDSGAAWGVALQRAKEEAAK